MPKARLQFGSFSILYGDRMHLILKSTLHVRVLAALVNSFIPETFTAEVLLNDRYVEFDGE